MHDEHRQAWCALKQIQDAISPAQKVTRWKHCAEPGLSSTLANRAASGHRPEHRPMTVHIVKLFTESLQSFGSGQLQLSKTLPRRGSGINTAQRSFPVGRLDVAALSQR